MKVDIKRSHVETIYCPLNSKGNPPREYPSTLEEFLEFVKSMGKVPYMRSYLINEKRNSIWTILHTLDTRALKGDGDPDHGPLFLMEEYKLIPINENEKYPDFVAITYESFFIEMPPLGFRG